MLVVVLIVGVVAAMLLPSLRRSMVLARDAVCKHNLREVGQSLRLYQLENDGWLPGSGVGVEPDEAAKTTKGVWFVQLAQNFLDPSALSCPCDPHRYRMMHARDKLSDPRIVDYPSYGLSSLVVYGRGGTLADVDRQMPTRPLDTVIVADLGPDNAASTSVAVERPVDPTPATPGKGITAASAASASGSSGRVGPARNGSMLSWDDGYDPLAFDVVPSWLTARHGDGINMLTLAGGVRAARTLNLMRQPVRRYYPECAAGGCSLCTARQMNQVSHYSFAQDRLYWWTGPVRAE